MNFLHEKNTQLKKVDLSRKASVDDKIFDLLQFLNNLECYYTTSSCSGRTVVLSCQSGEKQLKKGCTWLLVSHELLKSEDVINVLKNHQGSAVLKFEPFILHVRCQSLNDAQKLHAVSVESGFRNSGLTVGQTGKIIVAVRSTLSLEVPLSKDGHLLVSDEYINFVVQEANKKMEENWCRTQKFFDNFRKRLSAVPLQDSANVRHSHRERKGSPRTKENQSDAAIESHLNSEEISVQEDFYDGFNMLVPVEQ